jgi:hypothetical protein
MALNWKRLLRSVIDWSAIFTLFALAGWPATLVAGAWALWNYADGMFGLTRSGPEAQQEGK